MEKIRIDEAIVSLQLIQKQLEVSGTPSHEQHFEELIVTRHSIRLKRGTYTLSIPLVQVNRT